MVISEVSISNLRATKSSKINFLPGVNVLYGNNGVGKTTILEAICLLSFGKSFKTQNLQTIVKNKDVLSGAQLKTNTKNTLKIKIYKNKKSIILDEEKVKKLSDHIHFLPCIISSPDELVIEGKQNLVKQKNINKVLCITSHNYLICLKKYNTTLKQRNAAIKKTEDFSVWNPIIIECSKKIWEKREKYFKKINQEMKKINQKHNTNIETKIEIIGIKTNKKEIEEEIKKTTKKDIETKKTNTGPHTDKITYTINKKSVKNEASQGEKNLFFSILKKAESKIIKEEIKKEPIILLDDIFSKLDTKNIMLVLNIFKNNTQTIITHTDKITTTTLNQIKING